VSQGNEEMIEALLKCGADPRRLFGHLIGSSSTDKAQYDEPSLSTLVLSLFALTFSHAYCSSAERCINALLAAHRDVRAPRRMTSKRKRPSSPTLQAHHTGDEPEAPTTRNPKNS
jgi:hypothetical protein